MMPDSNTSFVDAFMEPCATRKCGSVSYIEDGETTALTVMSVESSVSSGVRELPSNSLDCDTTPLLASGSVLTSTAVPCDMSDDKTAESLDGSAILMKSLEPLTLEVGSVVGVEVRPANE